MKKPLIESIIFHIVIAILLVLSTWSFFSRHVEPLNEMPITVQLAPMGDKTNLKPAPKKQAAKPVPQKPAPKPPEPKKAEPKPPEPKKAEPKPQAKVEPQKEEPQKPEKKPEKPKEKTDELDKLLKDLDKQKPPEPEKTSNEEVTKEDSKSDAPFDQTSPETVSEIDYIGKLITDQIQQCWSPPAGVNGAKNLVIRVDVNIDRDGTMKFVGFENDAQYASDPVYQAAADSARRAVLDPDCNPLKTLPPADKYNIWKEMTLNFDPKNLIY